VKFAGRLVAGTVVVLFFTVAILVWTAGRSLQRNLEDELERSLALEARLVDAAVTASGKPADVLRGLERRSSHRIVLFDRAGDIIATGDTARAAIPTVDEATFPEVQAALSGGAGRDVRRADAISPVEMHVAIPTVDGAVRVSASMVQVGDIVKKARRAMLGAALVALIVGSGLAFVAGQSIARPLSDLAAAARAIANGSLPRFPRSGVPDIDSLVQAVRQMHRQLDERFAQLKNEQSASAALVESMLEGVIAADGRGRITTANAAARRLLGYAAEHPLPDVRQLFRSKSAREIVTSVLEGQAVQDRQLDLDGSTLLVNARPLDNEGAVLVLHDLTELRRLETVRRDFVANVSHELKTPLTSISGYAETLLTDSPDATTGREFLQIILSNAHRMQRLVDDLLDLSRIESGRWQPRAETVDVAGAAREVWATLAERAAARGTRFDLKVEPSGASIEADPDAVRQVLTNLIDNSLRYVGAAGVVTFVSRGHEGGVELSVRDNGVGITSDHLPRIFERFYRADPSRSREVGGTGLGLSIVKHLVEAHGGRVSAESELGVGTTIRVWFPGGREDVRT
jgi:signal transduction histidine kinase